MVCSSLQRDGWSMVSSVWLIIVSSMLEDEEKDVLKTICRGECGKLIISHYFDGHLIKFSV